MDDVSLGLSITLAAAMVIAGIVLWRIAGRTASGDLDRSRLAGVRTSATLASDEAWVAGHKAAESALRVAAVESVLTGAAFLVLPRTEDWMILILLVGGALMFGALTRAVIFANRAARLATS